MANTGEDIHAIRKIQDLGRWISVALLLLHIYYYCYAAFRQWHFSAMLSDRILVAVVSTGLFDHLNTSKLLSLGFLAFSLLGTQRRKEPHFSYKGGLTFILAGLLLYFGSAIILHQYADNAIPIIACCYIGLTGAGYLLILTGGSILSRVISASLYKDFFNPDNSGFRQEEKLLSGDFSINLPARYRYRGKVRNSHINFINPRRGVLIIGSPGCGKSWFIIEQTLQQLIKKGFAVFVYDFKYDVLTGFAYNLFLQHRDKYPPSTRFYSINFSDLSRSHRCNLIAPETMEWLSDAIGASRTIFLSMNKTWVIRQGEFFVESPINYLAGIIWFLRKFQGGVYCTLPHAIELALTTYEKLFTVLSAEPEIRTLMNPFIEAFRNKSMEMLDGQIASAKIALGGLASPDLYYILSGNDCTLDINDPAAPKILCLGGDPPRQEALAPIISLYIDRLNKLINRPGRYRTALICDEFATVRAYSMTTTIATARSNDIVPVMAVQDLSQLRTRYSRDEADLILNIAGNLICGQVGGDTARWVSERFPGSMQYKTTVSLNSSDTSVSKSEQMSNPISPATIATLSSGEFVGITADDPGKEMPLKAFHAKIIRTPKTFINKDDPAWQSRPIVSPVTPAIVDANFHRIRQEVTTLVETELRRILANPQLASIVVKK
jgi:YWFCY motif protein/type IV secretory system conjugative DNA transfer VirD4/TraG family protein